MALYRTLLYKSYDYKYSVYKVINKNTTTQKSSLVNIIDSNEFMITTNP